MEKERKFNIKKALSGITLAVAVSSSPSMPYQNQEQLFNLRDNSPNIAANEAPIKETIVFAANTETAPPSPSPEPSPIISPSPSPSLDPTPSPEPTPSLSPVEKRKLKIKEELSKINEILDAHPGMFSKKYKKDINLYYPIYKPVADKFKIDWYLIFIVHEKETGASEGTRGFLPSSYYKGAMQRDPYTWPKSFVDDAAKGLNYLKDLPQRHSDDWREIAAGAAILNRNIDHYMHLGNDPAVFNSLRLYTPGAGGYQRFELYKKYKRLFGSVN